ncbi:MAG: glycosyltransferase [Plectolyngbya sp. WJT66-NPBG17]|jgi:ceramide glucosyltransferase|nr:glycosyltransferase [Plectolyngbya sp. WJT66-NPBG17]MBW4526856.1 glycosyltransferase [Phormidium tanganyikae FI6-MK23]
MFWVEMVLVILVLGSIVFYCACAWFTYQFFSTTSSQETSSKEPVSVLVPICGLDEGAIENWSSLCTQDYPCYEVLFGVVDQNDPAVPVLHELQARFLDRVQVFVGLPPRGINHKDSTLSYLLEKTKYEILIFADSDIRVSPNYIQTVTAPLDRVDVITCAYIAHDPHFFASAVASLGRCCDFIPSALIARALDRGLQFAIGVTIAVRKTTLMSFGGLHLNRIGSDHNLGKRAAKAGYRVELSQLVLESDTGRETIRDLFQRELRWSRTIRFNKGAIYYSMIFCYGTVFCLPLLLISNFSIWAIALSVLTYVIRYTQSSIAIFSMNSPNLLRWLWALPFRDGLSFVIWVLGGVGREAYWRGRRLRIEGDGLIRQVDTPDHL